MTFGTAETVDEVPAYLARVRGGKPAPEALVAEFQRRFRLVGGSPLTRITREQAVALESELNAPELETRNPGLSAAEGSKLETRNSAYRVGVGMRHAPPFIIDGLAELAEAGVQRIAAIILSPQYSPGIMGGYLSAVEAARSALHPSIQLTMAGPWYEEPSFIDALAIRVEAAFTHFPPEEGGSVPVVFTAHSLPQRVAEAEPAYLEQLHTTAARVAERAGLTRGQWRFAYQSAGHTPEPWLKPDLVEVWPELRAAGHRTALVAPVQFVADHLEILYDIDVAAREQARAAGIHLYRTESLNTMPTFIRALASVAWREIAE
jgi:ferrochelatase